MNNKTLRWLIQTYKTFKPRRERLPKRVVYFYFNRIRFIYILLPDKIAFILGLTSPETNFVRKIIFFAELTENNIFYNCSSVHPQAQVVKVVNYPIS